MIPERVWTISNLVSGEVVPIPTKSDTLVSLTTVPSSVQPVADWAPEAETAQDPVGSSKQPLLKAIPFAKEEVEFEVEVMAPEVKASPPPERESPEEEKVEVAEPMTARRSISRRPAISSCPAIEEVADEETMLNLSASRFYARSRSPARVEVPVPDPKNWSASRSPAASRFAAKVEVPLAPWEMSSPEKVTFPVSVPTVKTELVAAFKIWKAVAELVVVWKVTVPP